MWLSQSNAKNVILLVSVTVVVITCSSLALWQYERGQYKAEIETRLARFAQTGAIAWHELHALPEDWLKTGLSVAVSGQLAEQIWWLDNQIVKGQFGYDLIVAVKPLTSPKLWLVNLGWFAGHFDRSKLPNINLPKELSDIGHLKTKDFKGFTLASADENQTSTNRLQYITPELAAQQLNQDVAPYMIYANKASALGKHHYHVINMSPQKHQAYALQWLLLAIAAAVIGFFVYRNGANNE